MYFDRVVFYDVIPLLTLSSSCLSLLVNIIGKLYRYRDHDGKTFSSLSKGLDNDDKKPEINDNKLEIGVNKPEINDKKSEINDNKFEIGKSISDTNIYIEKEKNPYYV